MFSSRLIDVAALASTPLAQHACTLLHLGDPHGEELARSALKEKEDVELLTQLGSVYLTRGYKGRAAECFHRACLAEPARAQAARDALTALAFPISLTTPDRMAALAELRSIDGSAGWTSAVTRRLSEVGALFQSSKGWSEQHGHIVTLGCGPLSVELCVLALNAGARRATAVCCTQTKADPITPAVLRQVVDAQPALAEKVQVMHLASRSTRDVTKALPELPLNSRAGLCLVASAAWLEHATPRCVSRALRIAEATVLLPGATIIPASVVAAVQPVTSRGLRRWSGVDKSSVCGLQLDLLHALRPPRLPVYAAEMCLVALGPATTLSRLDLTTGMARPALAHHSQGIDMGSSELCCGWVGQASIEISASGELQGIMFWFVDELDDVADLLDVAPGMAGVGSPAACRHVALLEEPVSVSQGDKLVIKDATFLGEPVLLAMAMTDEGNGPGCSPKRKVVTLRSLPHAERRSACADSTVQAALDYYYSHCWPLAYHFVMTNDVDRNTAFAEGLCAAMAQTLAHRGIYDQCVEPLVVDVGAGSGLMSLLAVNVAGARRVVAIEQSEVLGPVGERIVHTNGFDGAITYLRKHSSDVTVGPGSECDLQGPAAVWVAEIFGDDPLAEGVLETIIGARRGGIIGADTVMVPARLAIWGQLAESQEFLSVMMEPPQGFEHLLPFTARRLPFRRHGHPLSLLSEPVHILDIDLGPDAIGQGEVVLPITITADGCARFVIYWYVLSFPGGGTYSTYSGNDGTVSTGSQGDGWLRGSWSEVAYQLGESARPVWRGEEVVLGVRFALERLWFQLRSMAP